jgi:pentatricopeptide repeat protein
MLSQIEKAWEALFAELSENCESLEFNNRFLEMCFKTGNIRKAEDFYSRLMKNHSSATVFTFAGILKRRQKKSEDALKLFMDAWTIDQNNRLLLNTLGDFFIEDKKLDKARQYFEMSLFLYPEQNEIQKRLDELKN